MVKMLKRVIRNYWLAEETNIFRNYRDALAGFVALVIIPAVSVFLYYDIRPCLCVPLKGRGFQPEALPVWDQP
ncbi:hypothetical protein, partial [Enterocloster clostridioformis]|uniref:hypothetical protein n=1 Tax=Enterocloster clostridioformis TaxID=1531 RepID=UPI002480F3BB